MSSLGVVQTKDGIVYRPTQHKSMFQILDVMSKYIFQHGSPRPTEQEFRRTLRTTQSIDLDIIPPRKDEPFELIDRGNRRPGKHAWSFSWVCKKLQTVVDVLDVQTGMTVRYPIIRPAFQFDKPNAKTCYNLILFRGDGMYDLVIYSQKYRVNILTNQSNQSTQILETEHKAMECVYLLANKSNPDIRRPSVFTPKASDVTLLIRALLLKDVEAAKYWTNEITTGQGGVVKVAIKKTNRVYKQMKLFVTRMYDSNINQAINQFVMEYIEVV